MEGLNNHSVVMMTARTFSANPDLFTEPLMTVYLTEIQKLLDSHKPQDVECALSALFITFKQKKAFKYIHDKAELIKSWTRHAKTTNGELRVTFLVSLESLLERSQEGAEENAKFIYQMLARLLHGESENLKEFLIYLFQFLNAPFPQEELIALRVLQSMKM